MYFIERGGIIMINWKDFHSYRVFDEFIERFVVEHYSYITKHLDRLDFDAGLSEIKTRFIDNYDESKEDFELKLSKQFDGASGNARIIFTNIEYFWCMAMSNITPATKRSYVLRWFSESDVNDGDRFFFSDPHTIADPGQWNNRNKFAEICCIIRILFRLMGMDENLNLGNVKRKIGELAYEAIYNPEVLNDEFRITTKCSTHNTLLHLSNPDEFEIIVSEADKNKIVQVFGYLLEGECPLDRERSIKRIKDKLFTSHGLGADPMRKERWFFFQDDVQPLWKTKKGKGELLSSSIEIQIQAEENAGEIEGDRTPSSGTAIKRSSRLVKEVKERDSYTCLSCSFNYHKKIVQVHHLDPLSERKCPGETKSADLITLCPNCHYLAHYFLRKNARYKGKEYLLETLSKVKVK